MENIADAQTDQAISFDDLEANEDEFEEDNEDEFEDYDSPALPTFADARRDGRGDAADNYIDSLWRRPSGFGGWSRPVYRHAGVSDENVDRLRVAIEMVDSFVNSFSRNGHYNVGFDQNVSTARTNLTKKQVRLTPAVALDSTLTPEQAGRILTGMGVHEIAHPRYGRQGFRAVHAAFPLSSTAAKLSNLIADVHDERRFVEEYPGYSGVFEPMLDYIGKAFVTKSGGLARPRSPLDQAISAVRYEAYTDWTGAEDELRWWKAWAARWSGEDSPKRHVAAVRDGLHHIAEAKKRAEQQTQSDDTSDTQSDKSGKTGSDSAGRPDDQPQASNDISGNSASGAKPAFDPNDPSNDARLQLDTYSYESKTIFDSCTSEDSSLDDAAAANGVAAEDLAAAYRLAEDIGNDFNSIQRGEHGAEIFIQHNFAYRRTSTDTPSSTATAAVSQAFMRSRTGHSDFAAHQRHGRLDNMALARLVAGSGSPRVFEQRKAPSPGRYNVWVLVDLSGSMRGKSAVQASSVAHAIAAGSAAIPQMRVSTWGWTDGWTGGGHAVRVWNVWKTGQPAAFNFGLSRVRGAFGGTPDADVMDWAVTRIQKETHRGETPVIVMCSDGQGDMVRLAEYVNRAREHGVKVIGVSFGRLTYLSSYIYGESNYVPFAESIEATAPALARRLARLVTVGQ